MSFWLKALDFVSFIIPHLGRLIDDLVRHYGTAPKGLRFYEDQEYNRLASEILTVGSNLIPSDYPAFSLFKSALESGDMCSVSQLSKDYTRAIGISVSGYFIKPAAHYLSLEGSIMDLSPPNKEKLDVIMATFSAPFNLYVQSNLDMVSQFRDLKMDSTSRKWADSFLEVLDLIEASRVLRGRALSTAFKMMPYRLECKKEELTDSYLALLKIDYKIDMLSQPNEPISKLQLVPLRDYCTWERHAAYRGFVSDSPTILDMMMRNDVSPLVNLDPNFNRAEMLNAAMDGNLAHYNMILSTISAESREFMGNQVELLDLTSQSTASDLINMEKKYGVGGYTAYMDRVTGLAKAYFCLKAIQWQSNNRTSGRVRFNSQITNAPISRPETPEAAGNATDAISTPIRRASANTSYFSYIEESAPGSHKGSTPESHDRSQV